MKKQIYSKLLYLCIFIVLSIILVFYFNNQKNKWYTVNTNAFFFDTFITITLYYDDNSKKDDYEQLLIDATTLCNKYEKIFSYTNENSELFQINNSSSASIFLSKELYEILKYSEEFKELTKNSFNPFLGKLWEMWDYKASTVPSDEDIKNALNDIELYSPSLSNLNLTYTNINNKPYINFGAIAKGYIADKLKDFLLENGVNYGIINLGGNILAIGSKPNDDFYKVAITKPFIENEVSAYINIKNLSVVTSGIYERYFKENDKIYHHIINPHTGYPVENNLYSVTIITSSSTTADALSTSVFVMGLDAGLEFVNELDDVYAVFIDNNYNIILSNGLLINDKTISIINSNR